jgi:hypothetical protein
MGQGGQHRERLSAVLGQSLPYPRQLARVRERGKNTKSVEGLIDIISLLGNSKKQISTKYFVEKDNSGH